jgi:phosphoribosylglycinamide formyltransferase 1
VSGIVVLLSGSGTNLQAILDAKLPVKYVLSDKPNAYGLTRAEEAGIPTYVLSSLKRLEHKITNVCEEHKIDLIVLAGFMRLLSPGFVQRWESHIINIHPSVLPEFKGAGAIKQAFDAGINETGVTVHYVDAGMDTGSIIEQTRVPILNHDSLDDLEQRIHKVEHELYPRTIKWLLTNY